MIVLDGVATSRSIREELKEKTAALAASGKKIPHLAAVIVGNNGASLTYVNAKVKVCSEIGFGSSLIRLPEETTQEELLSTIARLNSDAEIDGFIVQLPLPKHIDEQKVIEAVDPRKDVDGFHPENVGKMALDLPCYLPATPYGILELLRRYEIPTNGKHCVVVGRSHIVGSPMSILMARNAYPGNCTVSLTHSRTADLKAFTLDADILIVALGKPEFVTGDMVKEGAVVVDVGITRLPDNSEKGYRIAGDVHYESVAPKCSHITPVPGGVGPMTIAALLLNTYHAATSGN